MNPVPAGAYSRRMDGRVSFRKILAVQIQHIRLRIERAPDGRHHVPSDNQPVCTPPMVRNGDFRHDDLHVWNGIDEMMLPRNGAPRHASAMTVSSCWPSGAL